MRRPSNRAKRYGHLPELGEINVMPLVDLFMQFFIAVIIFFPLVEYGMNINLPKGTTDQIKREQTRTLSVDKRGKIYLNDVALSRRNCAVSWRNWASPSRPSRSSS